MGKKDRNNGWAKGSHRSHISARSYLSQESKDQLKDRLVREAKRWHERYARPRRRKRKVRS